MRETGYRFSDSKVMGVVMGAALLAASPTAWAIGVQVAEAPGTNLGLTLSAIQSAKQSIQLNIYELSSPEIADALVARIQAGVQVEIIEEGQPAGGLSTASKGIQSELVQAMQAAGTADRLLEMTSKAGGHRRYAFDHAKYAVIDGSSLLIGSENYSPTGNPAAGSIGNRGWEVLIHDAGIAQQFASVFQTDSDVSQGDLLDLTASTSGSLEALAAPAAPADPVAPVADAQDLDASAVQMITSPDTSLDGLVAMINQAQRQLDIEQMTFDPAWGSTGQSPLLDAVVAAARRGVHVRVLLNDETVFDHPGRPSKPKNRKTISYLNQLAASENLNLEARVANLKAMGVDYIHNKGALADSDRTLISSINWDENAVERNREAAVLITSPDVHAHYEALFESDWSASGTSADGTSSGGETPQLVSLIPSQATLSDCPRAISVVEEIGPLSLSESDDADFAALSGATLHRTFTRASAEGCVLSSAGPAALTRRREYLEIRQASDGSRILRIEGYTPRSGKVFSIRARLPDVDGLNGEFAAGVYDSSGPGRERLGDATLTLQSEE